VKKSNKKAQLQISFGVMFSIIIIIATLAIAGYVIVKFLSTSEDVECKIFYSDLQKKIDEAWGSDGSAAYPFSKKTPGKTEKICFGFINQSLLDSKDKAVFDALNEYSNPNSKNNLFFYPINSCGESAFAFSLKHIKSDGFFCVPVSGGEANVKIAKGTFDALVKLSKT